MNRIALLICTYSGDNPQHFKRMLESVNSAVLPDNYSLRIYLHVDGIISDESSRIIGSFDIYKTIYSKEPIGLAHGLNKLILAREDESFFFRMDADDICCTDRFVSQIEFMTNNPTIDFSGANISEFVQSEDNIVYTRKYPTDYNSIIGTIVKASPFAHVTICFRDSFFEKYDLYPTDYYLCEDIAYWYKSLALGAKAANLDKVLVLVRMDDAYSRRGFNKSLSEFRVYLKIVTWLGHGFHYPVMRLFFRLFPTRIVKTVYTSKLRTFFVKKSYR